MHCTRRVVLATILSVGAVLLPGCKPSQSPVDRAIAVASSPTGGPVAAGALLVTDWTAGRVKLDECIDLAFEHLDSVRNNTPLRNTIKVSTSPVATAFAGAVLEAVKALEAKLPQGETTEIFWYRVGGLANTAAEEARQAGRGPEALFLVLNGGSRWQTEAYWRRHPTHDGLASLLLAESGNRDEALARLRTRPDLDGFAEEVYQKLGGR